MATIKPETGSRPSSQAPNRGGRGKVGQSVLARTVARNAGVFKIIRISFQLEGSNCASGLETYLIEMSLNLIQAGA